MNLKFLSAVAVSILLAACSSSQQTDSGAGAGGTTTPPPMASGPAPDSVEYFNSVVGNTVNFDFDKFDLDSSDQAVLRGQAAWLAQNPSRTLTVEGHCDERGTREYNLGLGERRANAVRQYLISQGVNASRVKTISYGKERPLCVASDENCYARNRRGVSVVQ